MFFAALSLNFTCDTLLLLESSHQSRLDLHQKIGSILQLLELVKKVSILRCDSPLAILHVSKIQTGFFNLLVDVIELSI